MRNRTTMRNETSESVPIAQSRSGSKSMPTQIESLKGKSEHLLDEYLRLCEKSALLQPLLFDKDVVDTYASGRRNRGFHILRGSLFLSCIQDIAKLVTDGAPRAPSIRKFVEALADESVVRLLRDRYASRVTPMATEDAEETDPQVLGALKALNAQEKSERRIEFDAHLRQLRDWWSINESNPALMACRSARDTVTAHTDVKFVADKYVTVDIGALGLKWSDVNKLTQDMQIPVSAIGHVVRCAGFAWEVLDEQLTNAAASFWTTDATAA